MENSAGFSTIDYIVFILYALIIVGVGLWISRTKKGTEKTADDYFLANKSLTWWAIGASLLAANISAEHFIAMSGSGYAIGLGIAAYEWVAALTLIIVGKYFLPIFIEKKTYTMPQFLNMRFNKGVSTAFAVYWLLVYIFVNLTSVTYLGALAMENILGIPLLYGIIGLAFISGVYSIYGGLKAVAWTDVIQVVFLVGGGLVTTFLALDAVGGENGGIVDGFKTIYSKATDHFQMIIERGSMETPDGTDAFQYLPGLAVIFGAMWLTNFGYWGFNQYIIQKGLAAKNLTEAKRGVIFAGYLKLLIPLLVIVPGITAYVLTQDFSVEELTRLVGKPIEEIGVISKSDDAYPWLLKNFVPAGIRGLAFAALVAAIVSSLASMINSTSTIFTVDIYREYINKNASNKQQVRVGRWVAFLALLIAVVVAPELKSLDQTFQYIQEFTGFIYPGAVVVFFMGLFWRQATANAALITAIAALVLGVLFYWLYPNTPFHFRMGYIFIILVFMAILISMAEKKTKTDALPNPHYMGAGAIKTGYGLIGLGILGVIFGALFTNKLQHLGFSSIFMIATAFAFVGIILVTNARMKVQDKKAIIVNADIFKTGWAFNLGAAGIIIIFSLLYIIFW